MMYAVHKILKAYRADQSGATAIEYGLILALMAIAIISAVTSTGGEVKNSFTTVDTQIQAGMAAQAGE